jgi:hypothetical protein
LRKFRILAVAIAGLMAFAAIAFAAQENTYTVEGSVTPSKVGTKKKPTPVQLKFGYTVSEKSGKRPGLINQYDIFFENGQVNTKVAKVCTAAQIDAAQSDAGCPKGSLVGTGNVENQAGATTDETANTITCHLDLRIHNGGNNHLTLYLHGGPDSDPAKNCPLAVDKAIDARFVKRSNGTSLVFEVDDTLLHPAPGFDNAVVDVNSTINKITKKIGGKTRGFFESAGKCKGGKSQVKVTFRQVSGAKQDVSNTMKCS